MGQLARHGSLDRHWPGVLHPLESKPPQNSSFAPHSTSFGSQQPPTEHNGSFGHPAASYSFAHLISPFGHSTGHKVGHESVEGSQKSGIRHPSAFVCPGQNISFAPQVTGSGLISGHNSPYTKGTRIRKMTSFIET